MNNAKVPHQRQEQDGQKRETRYKTSKHTIKLTYTKIELKITYIKTMVT